ncbi:hypothetical protein [Neorhizobium galegae]|uniref:hypothetical protein n=1 Tax=Neorhizobium galegae TaxID=399 RepID=UPI0006281524|nr:hypothetical protein [Neorhizobium galegae]
MTWAEFKALAKRRKSRDVQKFTSISRPISASGGLRPFFLPPGQACRGFLSEADRANPGYHDSFPPCVGPGGARQQEVLAGMRRLGGADDDEPKYDGRRKTGEEDE